MARLIHLAAHLDVLRLRLTDGLFLSVDAELQLLHLVSELLAAHLEHRHLLAHLCDLSLDSLHRVAQASERARGLLSRPTDHVVKLRAPFDYLGRHDYLPDNPFAIA